MADGVEGTVSHSALYRVEFLSAASITPSEGSEPEAERKSIQLNLHYQRSLPDLTVYALKMRIWQRKSVKVCPK